LKKEYQAASPMGKITRTVKRRSAGGRKRISTGHLLWASDRLRRCVTAGKLPEVAVLMDISGALIEFALHLKRVAMA
jgi:hypothetical protein